MPLLQALRDLGGSATPAEVRKKIIENEHLSDEVVNETRGKTQVNKFENEVAFARNYLVGAGYIDKSVRGVWTLIEAGKTVELTAEMASDIFKKGVSDAKSNKTNDSDALADNDIDTVRYWLYAPGQGADKWEECYKNGYMLLGWGEIGDLGVFSSKDEMKQQMKQEYGDSSSYKNSAHATWQFVHDIRVGDVVFVKKGKPHMGLTTWAAAPEGKIVKSDVSVAKNYLSEKEMRSLERIVSAYLDLAEDRAERHIPMTMEDWAKRLDLFLMADDREVLQDAGKITAEIAKAKAETEFEKYRVIQDRLFMSDFDKYMLELEKNAKK